MTIIDKELNPLPFDINNFINIETNIHIKNNENIDNLNINNLLINKEPEQQHNINNFDIDNNEINTLDFSIENTYEDQFYNIIYRNNIIIDKEIDTVINKYVNLNEIEPFLDIFFEKYDKYNNKRTFFWLILSLYYVNEQELFDFVYTLLCYSKNYNIYNNNQSYNSLKKLEKKELLELLKDYINNNRINFIFFLLYFQHYF